MKKRFLSKVLMLLLSIVMMFTLLVACNPEDEKVPDPTPTPPTMQDYLGEVGAAMDKAFSINAGKPFNVDLVVNPKFEFADKSKEQYNWDYSVKLKGNLNFAETIEEGKKRANELDFAVVNNTTDVTLFALALDGEYAYVTVGEEKLKFSSFDFYSAIRAYTGIIFDKESSLAEADIALAELLPLLGGSLFTSYAKTEVAGGFDYKFNFNLKTAWDSIIGTILELLPMDININEILGQLLNCPADKVAENLPEVSADVIFNVRADEMVGIDIKPAKIDIGTFNLDTELNCNPGINASFNLDKVKADFANIEAVKLLNINMSGTLNLINNANPDKSFFTLDWKLVANMDPMLLVQEKFNLDSDMLKDNFFHFQLSHICNEGCKADYCKDRLSSLDEDGVISVNDKAGAVLDIAFAPASITDGGLGNSNINVTINQGVLLRRTFLLETLKELGIDLDPALLNLLYAFTAPSALLQLDPSALLAGKDDLGKVETVNGETSKALAAITGSIDIGNIMGIIESLSNMITMDKQGIAIDLNGLGAIVGDSPILGNKSITDLICGFLDGKTEETKVDKLIIAGESGLGSEIFIDLFDPAIKNYKVYDEFVVFSDRENGLMRNYNAKNALIIGDLVTKDDGTLQLYTANNKNSKYIGKFSPTSIKDISNYYVSFNYIDVSGKSQVGFTNVIGLDGIGSLEAGIKECNIITGFAEGAGFLNSLNSLINLVAKGAFDVSRLPVPATIFKDVKIELAEETKFEVSNMDKKSYTIGDTIDLKATATITYKDETTATLSATGTINGGVNSDNVANKAGTYKITYYFAGRNVEKEITIADSKSVKYQQATLKADQGTKIDSIDFGKIIYTFEDGTTKEFKVNSGMVTFEKGIVQNGILAKVGKTQYTVNGNGLEFGNNIFDVDPQKSGYGVAYDAVSEKISFTNTIIGLVGQSVEFTANTAKLNGTAITDEQVKKTIKINGEAWDALSIDLPMYSKNPILANVTFDFSDEIYQNLLADGSIVFTLSWKMDNGTTGKLIITKKVTLSKFEMTNDTTDFSKPEFTFKYNGGSLNKPIAKTFSWKFEEITANGLQLFIMNDDIKGDEITSTPSVITATIDSAIDKEFTFKFATGNLTTNAEYQYKISCIENNKIIYANTTLLTKIVEDEFFGTTTGNPNVVYLKNNIVRGNSGNTRVIGTVFVETKMYDSLGNYIDSFTNDNNKIKFNYISHKDMETDGVDFETLKSVSIGIVGGFPAGFVRTGMKFEMKVFTKDATGVEKEIIYTASYTFN